MDDLKEIECSNCDGSGVGQGGEPCDKCQSYTKDTSQVEPKVRVKRNRGLKADISKLLGGNPSLSAVEVFEALKGNVYGGSNPISLGCVQSTISQLKGKKFNSPDLKEEKDSITMGQPRDMKVTASDGQDIPQL